MAKEWNLRIVIRRARTISGVQNLIASRYNMPPLCSYHCWLWSAVGVFGQTQAPPQSTAASGHQIPLPLLYRQFLAYQNHLDRVGAALDKQGKNGSDFRDHFQQKLGFTDAQFASIRETGLRLESELREEDAKAKNVIDAARAQYPKVFGRRTDAPPPPPELTGLQKERDGIIEQEIAGLNTALGIPSGSKS